MADGGGGNNGNGAPVESPPQPVTRKMTTKRKKKSQSPDEQSNGGGSCVVSGCSAPDGDGKENQEANSNKDRLVWCPKLHGKFVKACKELGPEDAVPMKILRRMNTNGVRVTRAQVASHLQKYRNGLSKQQEAIAVHQTPPLHEASPSQPTAPPEPLPPPVPPPPPPRPQAPFLEAPDIMCLQPLGHVHHLLETLPNCHGSSHTVAVAADSLHQQQQLQLPVVAPPLQQQCFAPPLHVQPPEALNTLGVPHDEESATGMAQLQGGANDQKEQEAAPTEPEVDGASASASYWDPPCSIIELYWRSDVPQPSWDLFAVPEIDNYMDALLAAISTPTRDR